MSPQRLIQLLQRATAMEWRAATAAGASVAAILVLTVGLSAARSSPVGSDEGARRVAAVTGGDLREAALVALTARMDPAAAELARRFDPNQFEPEDPQVGFPAGDHALMQLQQVQDAQARQANAAIPFALDVIPAAPFVLKAASAAERERAVHCLTNAIYYEAALEPIEGQRAVAQVVLNRVRNANFPKSICGVVYQGWEKLTGCQFSFTCDGALVRAPVAMIWKQNRKVAEAALNGYVMGAVGLATHYHADYVSPYWAPTLVKVSQIGAHIFYRWPGAAGQPDAFDAAYAGGETRISEAVLSGKAARAAAPPSPSRPQTSQPDIPGVRTQLVADAQGGTRTRVQASFAPAEYGRRAATPDEIARINALLEQRFPTKPAQADAVPAKPAPEAATAAPAQTLSAATPTAGAGAG
ncbi:MAG TPA: cell wall hydrolase [Caulobacteraceae bacterium]|jgi:spore germination cell wall hydrolase CwlJ-like protein|nr:cell wall hydrolase [Caulobacteraceae bacterium]